VAPVPESAIATLDAGQERVNDVRKQISCTDDGAAARGCHPTLAENLSFLSLKSVIRRCDFDDQS
jgi:hypothetical protein